MPLERIQELSGSAAAPGPGESRDKPWTAAEPLRSPREALLNGKKKLHSAFGMIKNPDTTAFILFNAEARDEMTGIESFGKVEILG
jgi:hypothetical protein